jgi:hypothetical protein
MLKEMKKQLFNLAMQEAISYGFFFLLENLYANLFCCDKKYDLEFN